MKKTQAIKLAGGVYPLATLLKISRQAVQKWPANIPLLRVYQLRDKRPNWFERKGKA